MHTFTIVETTFSLKQFINKQKKPPKYYNSRNEIIWLVTTVTVHVHPVMVSVPFVQSPTCLLSLTLAVNLITNLNMLITKGENQLNF